jgi:hypothetical protein
LILFWHWLRELAENGTQRVDFGPGSQRYKQVFANTALGVSLGTAYRSVRRQQWHQTWIGIRRQLRASRWRIAWKRPAAWMFRLRQQKAFR